jgi:hypothetical protein
MKKRPYQRGDLYLSQQTTPSAMKSFLIRGATSVERDNTVAFYFLASSEIWPDKRGGL